MSTSSIGAVRTALFFALGACVWCISAGAADVAPGASDVPIADKAFDFNVIAQETPTLNFTAGGVDFAAHVVDNVHRQQNGTLVFETRVTIAPATSTNVLIDQVGRTNYTGFSTDAIPEPDRGGTLFPETASRSADGSEVFFNFLSDNRLPVGGGDSSFFAIATDATEFALVGELRLHLANLGYTLAIPVFSPVPEAGELTFLFAGGALLALFGRRRAAAQV